MPWARRSWPLPLLILCGVAVSGCASDITAQAPADKGTTARTVNVQRIEAPDVNKKTRLALIHGRDKVKVGDEWEYAKKIFPEQRGAYEINDLPAGLTGPDYRARGWESANEGFGAILFDDLVAVAMYRLDRVDESRLLEFLDTYTDQLGRPNLAVPEDLLDATGRRTNTKHRVRYWFWEQETQRLMISAVLTVSDGMNVTVSVGDRHTMDALGMSPDAAKSDQAKAERAFEDQLQTQTGR
jgi:hypothetical protein